MPVAFHPFNRWAAIAIDGTLVGYMTHISGVTELHLKHDAPQWLRAVRSQGPFADHSACQAAIKKAVPTGEIPFGQNILQFPVERAT